tara:strand:+ start:1412 stop:2464 length:1053 start_codon:yes stop_codon:yes gene_type:complete
MNKINVLVTGVGGGGHGEQILKALRLAMTDYYIVGTDMSPYSFGLSDVDKSYVIPSATSSDYLTRLLEICKNENIQALFHGSEPELKKIGSNRQLFENEGIFVPINPQKVLKICMDKSKTIEFLKSKGFQYPKSITVKNKEDLNEVDYLPAVLKPSIGSGGSANIMLAQTNAELKMFGEYLLNIYPEFVVQEYIGTPDSEYTVGVLLSMDGELINSIAVKRQILSSLSNRIKVRNTTSRKELGALLAISSGVSQGEIGKYPEVTKQCEGIALALGCRGAVNVQCRFVNGKVYVFEINARFSGTTSLRAMVGYNEPDELIRHHLLREKFIKNKPFKEGTILRGLCEKFIKN